MKEPVSTGTEAITFNWPIKFSGDSKMKLIIDTFKSYIFFPQASCSVRILTYYNDLTHVQADSGHTSHFSTYYLFGTSHQSGYSYSDSTDEENTGTGGGRRPCSNSTT